MFYPYKKRITKLNLILNNSDEVLKKEDLERFIDKEKMLLNSMTPPACKSQALNTAKLSLKTLEAEVPEKLAL